MTQNKRERETLPVTGEVGSEGGSYADATVQVPTFEEELGRVAENAEPEKVQTDASDILRYPNEKS